MQPDNLKSEPRNDENVDAESASAEAFLRSIPADLAGGTNIGKVFQELDHRVEEDPRLKELKAMEADIANGVNSRGPLGLSFNRAKDGGQAEAYRGLKSHQDKRAFRAEWAQQRLANLKETRFKSVCLSKQHIEHGEYLPPDIIIDREGGEHRPAAKAAAATYISKCVQMGGRWCVKNEMTGRMEFLYIKKGYQELCTTEWTNHSEGDAVEDGKGDGSGKTVKGNSEGKDKGKGALPAAVTGKPKSKGGKAKVVGDPVAAPPAGSEEPPGGSPGGKAKVVGDPVKSASKVKQRYQVVICQATSLLQGSSHADWQWARDAGIIEGIMQPLKAALQAMEDGATMADRTWLTNDIKVMRKSHTNEQLASLCSRFELVVGPLLDDVEDEIENLVGMQNSRKTATRSRKA